MDTELYAATAEFYDYVVPYQTRQDMAFFVEAAQAGGGPVLEVGCGTGRVLIPTARAGLAVYGIDLSPHMLAVCEQHLEQEPAEVQRRVQLDLADMRDFDLGQMFKLITIPFRPFQHLIEVEDQIACLRCVRRHLAGDGRFILDLFNPSLPIMAREVTGEEQGDEPEFTMPDGRRVLRRNRSVARNVVKMDRKYPGKLIFVAQKAEQQFALPDSPTPARHTRRATVHASHRPDPPAAR